jgi:D-alanine--poly(phosphoribitol) ligase subunit 1
MHMFYKEVLEPILKAIKTFGPYNAFCIDGRFHTYDELAHSISKIRAEIRSQGIVGKNIGLIANDDIESYASILALWLEGYDYVPIHPRHPAERGLEVIRQAAIEIIIDSSDKPFIKSTPIIESRKLPFKEIDIDPVQVGDDEVAYILFTSGSTGKPKGVPITRGNLGAFMKAFWMVGFQIDENDRCLQCFDLTFDVSVQSFLVPLSKGACTYTIPHDQLKPGYAYSLMEEHKLTFGAMAPSLIRFLRPYYDEIFLPDLRYNILTAEASPQDLVEEWSKCIPNAEIYDFYGPTEATIYCTYSKFNRGMNNKQLNGMLSIGKALKGITAIVTDINGSILATKEKGELCISGDQVTRGYWNDPEKNQVSFIEKGMNGKITRFYRTGDLCFIDEEGDIMYSGRLDFQVKIQGFRIELSEIEYHARNHVKGQNVAAIAFENGSGNSEIALIVEGALADANNLLDYLKLKIPYYMIPSRIIEMKQFPLNSNGKIDRNMLKKSI